MNEQKALAVNGFIGLLVVVMLIGFGVYLLIAANPVGLVGILLGAVAATGIFVVQPNQAKAAGTWGASATAACGGRILSRFAGKFPCGCETLTALG